LKFLTNTKWCRRTKPRWLFPCAEWHPCWLFILHSKSTSYRWNKHSKLVIEKGINFYMFHLSIGKDTKNSKSNTFFLRVSIRCLRMKDLSLSCWLILISSLFAGACFFVLNGNHRLQAWLFYINHLHNDEPSLHIFHDSIILDTSHGFVELLVTMTKFNKYVLDPFIFLH
jgi:hypothetical protein